MMYQCLLGSSSTAGASASVAPSAAAFKSGSATSLSFSSCAEEASSALSAACPTSPSSGKFACSVMNLTRKRVEHLGNDGVNGVIDEPEVGREQEDRDDDNESGGAYLFPVGPRDPSHLQIEFVDVIPGPRRPTRDALEKTLLILFVCHLCSRYRHAFHSVFTILGRGRGIRTPKGGFGDRWFTVSLCPYSNPRSQPCNERQTRGPMAAGCRRQDL